MSSTWDILIATYPQRHEQLCGLLAELDRQYRPGLMVRVFRDNLKWSVGTKRQKLLESSFADYVCFVDDDDEVAPDYVSRIQYALRSEPDYVGFMVKLSVGGHPWVPAQHSLRHAGWVNTPDMLLRDISHLNPIRRTLARQARFDSNDGGYGEDGRWADRMRELRIVKTEQYLGEAWAYHYRMSSFDNWDAKTRRPVPLEEIKPLPVYPWLVIL